jgi:hypothetical protein
MALLTPEQHLAMSRKGGKAGGRNRSKSMTAAERSESARKAVKARWAKRKKKAK